MTSTFNGQVLGEAEKAAAAVLIRLLARTGTTFHQWVVLNATSLAGGTVGRADLVTRMVHGLKVEAPTVESTVDSLIGGGLLRPDPAGLVLTDVGRDRHAGIQAAIADVNTRFYGDLPAEDLATTARVLRTLTERANAELAA